ncbi:LysE family translocator [Chryseobacterium culicis]|uniref:Lysine transporter LysE n=1 Tax=Chryseobacterium culicis TaxID=680127 RepID=A0A2S9D0G0_CHRCI|nr:LysE family translocator [Chryseobacterium culicis]PRB86200.1 lysine transporter LysE [Chryseobacterium culicis]PRB91953.1 lysine transporter LysE [Chryseobacterium culicis]
MIPFHELIFFILAALILVISPGPNMIYLISKSITQGKKSGFISLTGVVCGFLFHIIMVSFGLTAVLLAVPFAYTVLKAVGTLYLLYLAYQAIKPNGRNIFDVDKSSSHDSPKKLFTIGFLTNVLNPKVAVFYLSFFPQFIKPEYGSVFIQSLELGVIQVLISFSINFIIVLAAARVSLFFSNNPVWIKVQKWFMASVLTYLAIKMAFSKAK